MAMDGDAQPGFWWIAMSRSGFPFKFLLTSVFKRKASGYKFTTNDTFFPFYAFAPFAYALPETIVVHQAINAPTNAA